LHQEGRLFATPRRVATQDTSGLTACFDLIIKLERELKTAHALREELTQLNPAEQQSVTSVVRGHCRQLLDDAVEVVRATATVQDEVCGLASNTSVRSAGVQAEGR
jgi:hypothetical protein